MIFPLKAFLASGVPLQTLDLSNNWLRRLTEKSLEGLTESLEILVHLEFFYCLFLLIRQHTHVVMKTLSIQLLRPQFSKSESM